MCAGENSHEVVPTDLPTCFGFELENTPVREHELKAKSKSLSLEWRLMIARKVEGRRA